MIDVHNNFNLKDYNSWKINSFAEYACLPKNLEELKKAQQWAQANNQPLFVLGGGTNILLPDSGVKGLLILLKHFKGIEVIEDQEQLTLKALAGTPKFELMRYFMKYKLSPALFLSGLPGDVAGGVVMNAGVSEARVPREFCEVVQSFDVLKPDNSIKTYHNKDIHWEYRNSSGWQPGIITQVTLSWPMQPDIDIPKKVKEANMLRLSKQPLDQPSCGSTFTNPPGELSAGALIDSCGLKGYQIGGAQVSTKHANFLINTGTASASDFKKLIQHIQKTVLTQKGIHLHTEVKSL